MFTALQKYGLKALLLNYLSIYVRWGTFEPKEFIFQPKKQNWNFIFSMTSKLLYGDNIKKSDS